MARGYLSDPTDLRTRNSTVLKQNPVNLNPLVRLRQVWRPVFEFDDSTAACKSIRGPIRELLLITIHTYLDMNSTRPSSPAEIEDSSYRNKTGTDNIDYNDVHTHSFSLLGHYRGTHPHSFRAQYRGISIHQSHRPWTDMACRRDSGGKSRIAVSHHAHPSNCMRHRRHPDALSNPHSHSSSVSTGNKHTVGK